MYIIWNTFLKGPFIQHPQHFPKRRKSKQTLLYKKKTSKMSSVIDTIRRKEVLTYNFEGDIPVLRKILDDTKYKLEFRHKCADLLLMIEHRHR